MTWHAVKSRPTSQKVLREVSCTECTDHGNDSELIPTVTRRPASADRTACRQFQATSQPVSRTQASDAMTSRLPRYEMKCVQRRCLQWGSVPLRSDIKGTELPPPIYWYHLKGNWLRYEFAADSFYILKLCSRLFVLYRRNCPKDDKCR